MASGRWMGTTAGLRTSSRAQRVADLRHVACAEAAGPRGRPRLAVPRSIIDRLDVGLGDVDQSVVWTDRDHAAAEMSS